MFIFSQENWETIGLGLNASAQIRDFYNDTANDRLIMIGSFASIDTFQNNGIAVYDGNTWDCFSEGLVSSGMQIYSIIEYHDTLYIGGWFWDVWNGETVHNIAKWNGNTWVGLGFNTEELNVYNMRIINNELFILTAADSINGIEINGVLKYNGNEWSNFYDLPKYDTLYGNNNMINDIAYYKGEYYIGGNFSNNNLTIQDIVKYNGTEWVDVGGSIKGSMSTVNRMVVYNNELIVAGAIFKSDGNIGNLLQKWNGTEWNEFINLGYNNNYDANAEVKEMKIYNNKLYMSGIFRYANDMPCAGVIVYDGNQVCSYASSMYGTAGAFGFYHDTLYIAGMDSIDHVDVNRIAKWIGGNDFDTCSVLQSVPQINNELNNLIIYPNPANGEFNIKLNTKTPSKVEITIFNINGSKTFEKQFYQTNEIKIDNLHSEKGVYFVKIKTDKFIEVEKLIIN